MDTHQDVGLEALPRLVEEMAITPRQIMAVAKLLSEGNTIPFIARYRKEVHGNLDEVQISKIQESLNYWKGWRTSVGVEYSYFKKFPFRMGFALGGLSGYEIDLGTGLSLGFAHLDWSIGFHRGIWIHTAQGLNFSLGVYFTGKTKK